MPNKLHQLLTEATPGPWRHPSHGANDAPAKSYIITDDYAVAGMFVSGTNPNCEADAALIVYLRNHADEFAQWEEREPLIRDLIDAAAISRDDAEWLVENEASGRALLIAERLAAVLARLEGTE